MAWLHGAAPVAWGCRSALGLGLFCRGGTDCRCPVRLWSCVRGAMSPGEFLGRHTMLERHDKNIPPKKYYRIHAKFLLHAVSSNIY